VGYSNHRSDWLRSQRADAARPGDWRQWPAVALTIVMAPAVDLTSTMVAMSVAVAVIAAGLFMRRQNWVGQD
jgi:hypothetical protein